MAARRDDNPPEDWTDKITDNKQKPEDEQDGEMKPSFKVNDRRHWKNPDEESDEVSEDDLIRPPAYVKALEEELNKKDETLKEYIAQYKDAKSEMNEAISRIEREKAREINFRIAELAKTFLSILDDLEAATQHATGSGEKSSIAEGLVLINQRIKTALDNIGIEEIEALGKSHDPNLHEAVAVDPVDDPEKDGVIIEVFKKGYKLGDVLVRPASVVVGKFS